MTKWEYMTVWLSPQDSVIEKFNRLGVQGWELVARKEEQGIWIFKRPLDEVSRP